MPAINEPDIDSAVVNILLAKIEPSPSNPRKTFPHAELEGMAVTIREKGVLVPIKVRPHPTKNHGSYELVDGECRWRASQMAGCSTIPALVEVLDDTEVLEHQLIANAQRFDVHPIEEGEAYARLLNDHEYSMDKLVAKTGRSRSHLYGRLKLTELAPTVKKACVDGKLPAMHAELIARIPDAKLQAQCLKEVLGDADTDAELDAIGVRHEGIGVEGVRYSQDEPQPLSFRATQALIRRRYMTKLDLAKFNPADASLTPAGACTSCPHRSGNQPELPGLVSKSDDLCTKPTCYEEKTRAQFKVAAAAAKERGVEVLSKKDAEDVFAFDGVTVTSQSDYVDLETELPWNIARAGGGKKTFGKLLGKHAVDVPKVLVQDESGAPRELLDKKKAIAKLKELGKIDAPEKPKKTATDKAKAKEEKLDRETKEDALGALLYAMRFAVMDAPATKDLPWLRWLARVVISPLEHDPGFEFVADKKGWNGMYGALSHVDKVQSANELRALLIEILVAQIGDNVISGYVSEEEQEWFDDACKLAGLNWPKVVLETVDRRARAAGDLKKLDAKRGRAMDGKDCGAIPSKGGAPCIHDVGHEGVHSNGKTTWSDRKSKKKGGGK